NAVCLGLVEGVIGKIRLHSEYDRFLLLVRQKTLAGRIPPGHQVFTVSKVVAIPLSEEKPQDLEFEERQKEKLTRRLLEELLKIFTDTNSFYFSSSYDLTSSLQRQCTVGKQNLPLLQQVDDRFFWNKYMMKDVIELQDPRVNDWVTPIIQGFVAIKLIMLSDAAGWDERSRLLELFLQGGCSDSFLIALISRRSRHRAGMRYKCRGVDSKGHASIYVETEQIVYCRGHTAALVLVRGSLPVIWSQPGYRYNPLPVLNKNETETQAAFKAHFDDQLKNYNKQVIINLVKQGGPEKIVGDAFLRHVLLYNSADLTYVSFDFHEHWKNSALHDIPTVQLSEKDLEKAQCLYHNLLEDICLPENPEETHMGKGPHGAFELNENFKYYDREELSDSDDDLCASSHLYRKSPLIDLGGSYRSAASSSFIPCALPKAKSCKSHLNIQISEGNEDQLKTLVVLPFADCSELASSTSREALAPGTTETTELGRLLFHTAAVASASERGAEAVLSEAEINIMVKNCKTRIIQI
ncbi:UNVERIFIED_CONTAM: hypothetical protein FKN15_026854, partial [Acipenser sinensis]